MVSCSDDTEKAPRLCRRSFLQWGAVGALGLILESPCFAAKPRRSPAIRTLSFYNPNTHESLKVMYWTQGNYVKKSLDRINHLLRDYRTNEIKSIEPKLLDFLHAISLRLKSNRPFHVISGYRSPETNEMLRRSSRAVARNSLHMSGKAVDIRVPGLPVKSLRRAAIDLHRGGVGYYPRPAFVHVDVGEFRYW